LCLAFKILERLIYARVEANHRRIAPTGAGGLSTREVWPFLINIYNSDLPNIVSRKYTYADDLAVMHADGDCSGRGAEQGHANPR